MDDDRWNFIDVDVAVLAVGVLKNETDGRENICYSYHRTCNITTLPLIFVYSRKLRF